MHHIKAGFLQTDFSTILNRIKPFLLLSLTKIKPVCMCALYQQCVSVSVRSPLLKYFFDFVKQAEFFNHSKQHHNGFAPTINYRQARLLMKTFSTKLGRRKTCFLFLFFTLIMHQHEIQCTFLYMLSVLCH